MKKAIVTGATGAVGMALVNKLISQGLKPLSLFARAAGLIKFLQTLLLKLHIARLMKWRIFKMKMMKNMMLSFILRGQGPYGKDRDNMFLQSNNIKNELEAVKLAKRFGCDVFVGAGSQAENGRLENGQKVAPDSPTNPNNGYGIAKLAAGKMSRILCSQLGIRHIWCRILSAYSTR